MTTQPAASYDSWIGSNVYDANGEKVGQIDEIFYDDVSGRPEWVTVKSGFFGTKKHFVPILGSTTWEDGIKVNYSKDIMSAAPGVDADYGHLAVADEQMLYTHYNIDWNDTKFPEAPRADIGYQAPYNRDDYDERGRAKWEAVETEEVTTRTEKPRMEKDVETGKVRLRKYRITEQVTMPVTREEVRVERDSTDTTTGTTTTTETVSDDPTRPTR